MYGMIVSMVKDVRVLYILRKYFFSILDTF